MFNLVRRWTIGFLLVASTAFSFGQEYQGKQLVQATLIADTTAVVPGQRMQLGLLLQMAPGWHTYWQFPGDVGIPTSIQWEPGTDLAGLTIGPLQWPLPERKELPGDIVDYAYSKSVLLLMDVVVPENLAASEVTFSGKASWLVCEEICVPGDAPVSLTLPVSKQAEPAHQELFAQARNVLPKTSPPPFALQTSRVGKIFEISLENLPSDTKVDFYPTPGEGQVVGHTKASEVIDGRAILRVPIEGDLRGVLVVDQSGERTGYSVALENPADSQKQVSGDEPTAANLASGSLSLGLALVSGLLGGLILNLMPCVLPVISLKIFGFIKHAGEEPRKIFLHGLAFTAGIFAWFMGLALVIILLKQSGQQVTWAFQFQNPIFNLAIGAIVLVFALNLFGVFEITLPGQAGSSMANLAAKDGYSGSFFQGVFATLLATPCTAPFLGNALGFAFSQSAWIILAMFGAIALGMAGPYLILSAQPAWMKFLPKPGPWMERVKQFMGFPLLATLVWLLFVLGGQKGVDGMIAALSFFVILALCCWIFGAFCSFGNSGKKRLLGAGAIAALLLLGIQFFLLGSFASARTSTDSKASTSSIAWQDFSQAALNALLAEGKPVFVDFTADWCISCKFNERTAIDRPAVREALANAGIIPMKADWTNSNPEITAALKEFGRVGVPFYVIYPAGRKNEPIILPEILTEQIVLDAIAKASKEQ